MQARGSTLTQQVAKKLLFWQAKTIFFNQTPINKIRELFIARTFRKYLF